MLKSNLRSLILAGLYLAQGTIYVIYSLWLIIVEPLQYFNAPEPFGILIIAFLIAMLAMGVYFIVRTNAFLKHRKEPSRRDLLFSVCSVPFWLFPTYFAFGIVLPFISASADPLVQVYHLQFLLAGILFCIVGASNIAAIVIAVLGRRTKSAAADPKDKSPRLPRTGRQKKTR